MIDPKFVIGIGSQRAGSTLLHKILDECTDIFMHPVKELHFFDTLFGVRNPEVLVKFSQSQLDSEFERLIKEDNHGYIGDKRYKCYLRANWILSRRSVESLEYLDLYRPCIKGNEYIGEITPEYMILPEEGVRRMAECVGKYTPIILLSRDPVERFISAFKLLKTYGRDIKVIENFDEELQRVLDEMPEWIEQQKQLNDFETALKNYKKYFDNVCFIKYENLICNESSTFDKLQASLGVSFNRDKVGELLSVKVNQIGETGNVKPETLELLNELFRKETEYLEDVG